MPARKPKPTPTPEPTPGRARRRPSLGTDETDPHPELRRNPPRPDVDVPVVTEILRICRGSHGMTAAELAAKLGWPPGAAARKLRAAGPRQPLTVADLCDIARALDVDPAGILIAAGLAAPRMSALEAVEADPDLSELAKSTIYQVVRIERRGRNEG